MTTAATPTPTPVTKPAATAEAPVVDFDGVSKWYGNVIGLNKVTLQIGRGITGLLGPNGAGKSTLLQLATGQLRPSQGRVRVLGQRPWDNPRLNRRVGLCPEQDALYERMTGREFVTALARLGGLSAREAIEAADSAIERVGLTTQANRAVGGYSKGMRQRIKLAQALVHDPEVLFLDEPLSGTDPVIRRELIEIILGAAAEGRAVVLSSHVLYEVQAITPRIALIHRGRLVATGDLREIRDLIDRHPHRIVLRSTRPRDLAAALVKHDDVVGVEVRRDDGALLVETDRPDVFYDRLADLALDGLPIDEVYSDDDNLEAVFRYLVNP